MAVNQEKKKNKTVSTPIPKKAPVLKKDLFDTLDDFFTRKGKLFFYAGIGLTILFSLLLFDLKVSPGGDDSAYISRAFDFAHGFTFPGFSGPFYPIVLSIFIWIFGINLFILKLFSLLCMVGSMFFFYKTFSGKIPQTVVTLSFIILGINYSLLYYSSQTYSEAFFILLQSIFFWFAASKFTIEDLQKNSIGNYLVLGLLVLLLTLTRNIAFAAIIAVTFFFLINRKWKETLMWLGSDAVC